MPWQDFFIIEIGQCQISTIYAMICAVCGVPPEETPFREESGVVLDLTILAT